MLTKLQACFRDAQLFIDEIKCYHGSCCLRCDVCVKFMSCSLNCRMSGAKYCHKVGCYARKYAKMSHYLLDLLHYVCIICYDLTYNMICYIVHIMPLHLFYLSSLPGRGVGVIVVVVCCCFPGRDVGDIVVVVCCCFPGCDVGVNVV